MKKILIIDDEIHLCWLIQKLITDEFKDEFEILQSYDGFDAYEKICSNQPDLVISDIRIPGYDGIELVRRTRESGLNIPFIIISGYKQFEYAHSAIKFGVENYLLKPINSHELITAIKKIDTALHAEEETEEIKTRNLEFQQKIRRYALEQIISTSSPAGSKNEFIQFNEQNYFHFSESSTFRALYIRFRYPPDSFVISNMKSVLYRNYPLMYSDLEILGRKNDYIIILNISSDANTENVKKEIQYLYQSILSMAADIPQLCFSFGLGIAVSRITDLKKAVISAYESCLVYIIDGYNRYFDAETLLYPSHRSLSSKEQDELMRCFESGRFIDLEKIIDSIFNEMLQNPGIHPKSYFSVAEDIIDTVNKYASSFANLTLPAMNLDDELKTACSVMQLSSIIKDRGIAYMEELCSKTANIEKTPVRIAQKYINEHLAEAISLADVAGLVYLNPVYFSVLFKKETKQNFSSYIASRRIEKAKELLTLTNMTIQSIAEKVGYADSQTFSKRFRKEVGILPKDYRRFHKSDDI